MIRSKVSGILLFMLTAVLLILPAIPVLAASDGGGTPMANRWIALRCANIIALDTVRHSISLKQGQLTGDAWFPQTAIPPFVGGLLLLIRVYAFRR